MKVYIVMGSYDYEGYSLPDAVFSTKEKAEEFIANYDLSYSEHIEYVEMEVL